MSNLVKPGISMGSYPEKIRRQAPLFKAIKYCINLPITLFGSRYTLSYRRFAKKIEEAAKKYTALSEAEFEQVIFDHRAQLSIKKINSDLTLETFALVAHATHRALGIKPFHTQLMAARMIYDGKLVEMATGEGKTLAVGLGCACAAMAGIPVHAVTSNDYLVKRDAEGLAPLFQKLGLSVSYVCQGMDTEERTLAYAANITYCTAKELVFDYLRDQISLKNIPNTLHLETLKLSGTPINTMLHGLHMVIIDEADSILIDEAKVPLLISKSSQHEGMISFFEEVLAAAKSLKSGQHYVLNEAGKSAELTNEGWSHANTKSNFDGAAWNSQIYLEEVLCQALAALHCYQRDKHYLVTEQGVEIIDEITGRVSPGRVWSRGLHQLIELKEGCKPTGELITITQITYQRFFSKYLSVGGMSGTLIEAKKELFDTYELLIKKVPLRLPSKRNIKPTRLFPNQAAMWDAVLTRVQAVYKRKQPLLIGTDSVLDSQNLSNLLTQLKIPHQLLNARQNQEEALIISQAGQVGQITISTNIAGRGTDIELSEAAKSLGGLHVLSCQHNLSKRIDRQLIGRCARQGNPGVAEMFYTLDKINIYRHLPSWLITNIGSNGIKTPTWFINFMISIPKWIDEYHQREQRYALHKHDIAMEENTPSLNSKM